MPMLQNVMDQEEEFFKDLCDAYNDSGMAILEQKVRPNIDKMRDDVEHAQTEINTAIRTMKSVIDKRAEIQLYKFEGAA